MVRYRYRYATPLQRFSFGLIRIRVGIPGALVTIHNLLSLYSKPSKHEQCL